jgi:hypothetical protein
MRTEIEKQQIKRIIVHLNCQEKEERKNNKSIIGGNPTIIGLHPHYMKESTVMHPARR